MSVLNFVGITTIYSYFIKMISNYVHTVTVKTKSRIKSQNLKLVNIRWWLLAGYDEDSAQGTV